MVTRVPLLGMVVAVLLLLAENFGANLYLVAQQRAADAQRADTRTRAAANATRCPKTLPTIEIARACIDNPLAKECF